MSHRNHTLADKRPFQTDKRLPHRPREHRPAPLTPARRAARTVVAAALFLAGGSAAWAQASDDRSTTAPQLAPYHADVTGRMQLVNGQWQLSLTGTVRGQLITYRGTLVDSDWDPALPEASGDLAHFLPHLATPQLKELLSALVGQDVQPGGAAIQLSGDRADRLPSVTLKIRTSLTKFQSPAFGTKDEVEMVAFLAQRGWRDDEIHCLIENGRLPEGRTLGEDDCGPEMEQTICVEGTVSIPPFVNMTVKVCTTIRARACEFAQAREEGLRQLRQTVAEMIEDLKKQAEDLAQWARDAYNRFVGWIGSLWRLVR